MATLDKNIIDKIRKHLDVYSDYSPELFNKTVKELEKSDYDLSARVICEEIALEWLDGDGITIDELIRKLKKLKDLGHETIYRDSGESCFYIYNERKETIDETSHRILNDYFWPIYKRIENKQAEMKHYKDEIKRLQDKLELLEKIK